MLLSFQKKLRRLLHSAGLELSFEKFSRILLIYGALLGLACALFFLKTSVEYAAVAFLAGFLIVQLVFYALLSIMSSRRAQIVEDLLPDFLALMAANIRSGLTPDRALLVSSRKELGPLSIEIEKAAKKSLTGVPLDEVFLSMRETIDSEVLDKTMNLIVEGIRSGGELGDLLERTSFDLRKFASVRKEVQATVMVYEIFIFFATAIGAPALYGVSTFLVETLGSFNKLTSASAAQSAAYTPFSANAVSSTFSSTSLVGFSVLALIVTTLFGSMAMGVIHSGKKTDGLKYFPVMVSVALVIFFGARIILASLLGGLLA